MSVHTPGINNFPELRFGVRKCRDEVIESGDTCTKENLQGLRPIGFSANPGFCNKLMNFSRRIQAPGRPLLLVGGKFDTMSVSLTRTDCELSLR